MTERIQKVLARAGVASRRQVEDWIKAGRVTVNGAPASVGAPVGPRDRVMLDGRVVRLSEPESGLRVVLYHRAPGVNLTKADDPVTAKLLAGLPKRAGRRWMPVTQLPPNDGGLELLTTDGTLVQALTRKLSELPVAFAVRVRGEPRLEQLDRIKTGVLAEGAPLQVEAVELAGGEASNRWFDITVRGGRARDVRALFDGVGLEISRLMRVSLGPIKMDRGLARGRSVPLQAEETEQLYALAGAPMAAQAAPPAKAGGGRNTPRKPPADRRPIGKAKKRAVARAASPAADRKEPRRSPGRAIDKSKREQPTRGKPAREHVQRSRRKPQAGRKRP